MSSLSRSSTVQLEFPYRMQEHPADPTKLSSQQILERVLAPQAPYTRIGFGGPKGGGKSYGARAMAFKLTYMYPIVAVVIRSRLTTLKRNHIIPAKNELRDWLEHDVINYNEQDKIFYMPNGGMVQFMYCDNIADVEQFEGVPGDLYIFEEAGHYTKDMIDGIIKNNRSSDIAINRGAKYRPRSLFTFNWGGPGHQTLRRWFWDKIYDEGEIPEKYFFIFAPLDQNRKLLDANPEYVDNLKALPKQLRDAYLNGDPDAFVGSMFMIIRDFHEVDPHELLQAYNPGVPRAQYQIPESWRVLGSLDAGIGAPCSFGLYALTPEGKIYKMFTYYDIQPAAPIHVEAIMKRIDECTWTNGRRPDYIVADSYAFHKGGQMGAQADDVTWEDLFALEGIALHRIKYDRVAAIMALQTALHFELDQENKELELEPKLQLFEGQNEDLIDELQAAERDKRGNPELPGKNTVDHAIDETKNMIMCAEAPPAFVPLNKPRKQDEKKDYGSRVDRVLEFLKKGRHSESFRDAL